MFLDSNEDYKEATQLPFLILWFLEWNNNPSAESKSRREDKGGGGKEQASDDVHGRCSRGGGRHARGLSHIWNSKHTEGVQRSSRRAVVLSRLSTSFFFFRPDPFAFFVSLDPGLSFLFPLRLFVVFVELSGPCVLDLKLWICFTGDKTKPSLPVVVWFGVDGGVLRTTARSLECCSTQMG